VHLVGYLKRNLKRKIVALPELIFTKLGLAQQGSVKETYTGIY